ncbi:hypothetical protein TNIN_436631 [Trichonephila inaurata madagascariensis]|uniref:Uncharacterized protein n=1 Tax=Trichonephila inaurata madagascariensis TaxID=2747483 RepID=A0A8X6XM48_9ARAC|nr:hypothetical protein TNIN_436631 [Trichonephila inaurata madagascariensis]
MRVSFTFLRGILSFFAARLYKEYKRFFCFDRFYDEKTAECGDLYIKNLVDNITIDRAKKYDPYIFGNLIFNGIVLHYVHLTGLKTLHQAGSCALTETDGKFLVNANLGAGPLHFQYDVLMRLGNFKRKLKFSLSLTYAKVLLDFSVLQRTGGDGALLNVSITEFSGLQCFMSVRLLFWIDFCAHLLFKGLVSKMGGLFLKSSFLAIALVFCVYIHQAACFLDEDDENVVRGNKFIDDLLHDMLEENGHEYDPYRLEDSVVGFSKKVAFVNVSGEAKLHNGYITGLKSLHRPDHCTVEDEDGKLLVKADLGAGVLDFYYDGTVKFMSFGPTITLHAELAYLEIHMEFTVDSKTGRDGELKKFVIDDMKGMKMSITGLGPMNWAANYIIGGVTSLFQGFLRNFMQKKVRNHIAERLPRYQFPVDGDDIEVTVPEIVTKTEAPEETVPEETEAPEEIVPEETEALEEIEDPENEALKALQLLSYLML